MPGGVPVGTLAIGASGAKNAALLAVRMLATTDAELATRVDQFIELQTDSVADVPTDE
jgi:5-(carboxyamino)imidazole ribonucleotide mutase